MPYSPLGAGISVLWALLHQWRPFNGVKCIESDSCSAIYTSFVLDIINVMMNLKQYTVNGERFAGLNFRVFHDFQEYRQSFSVNLVPLFNCTK